MLSYLHKHCSQKAFLHAAELQRARKICDSWSRRAAFLWQTVICRGKVEEMVVKMSVQTTNNEQFLDLF